LIWNRCTRGPITELKQQRTKLLLDAQKLVTKKDVTKEERAQSAAMVADVDLIDEQIALEERIAKELNSVLLAVLRVPAC
jgi:hypothetical protein